MLSIILWEVLTVAHMQAKITDQSFAVQRSNKSALHLTATGACLIPHDTKLDESHRPPWSPTPQTDVAMRLSRVCCLNYRQAWLGLLTLGSCLVQCVLSALQIFFFSFASSCLVNGWFVLGQLVSVLGMLTTHAFQLLIAWGPSLPQEG